MRVEYLGLLEIDFFFNKFKYLDLNLKEELSYLNLTLLYGYTVLVSLCYFVADDSHVYVSDLLF
jgi:hypothetical protein